ncbi:MAG: hypothetical protein HYV09_29520 [Deltaproteobacteria bacterium]|nr:hypothetical protein [Deltaproteobacteria bacterium]
MRHLENGHEIGRGITGMSRFFDEPCGCGSARAYGACCGALEGDGMYSMLVALLEPHRAMFPWIDGGGPGCS